MRKCLDSIQNGDILVGDAFYATYFLLCALLAGGVDGVFEQYGARRRSTDFSKGERLGVRDHIVVLEKPKKRPDWMSPEEYAQVPETIRVREVAVAHKILVTTFLDPKDTPKKPLWALDRRRWNVELDLRNLKTTLGMGELRCRTPAMAEKKLWAYLLAYNLIRLVMALSALLCDQVPRQLSFKHAVQVWLAWWRRGADPENGAAVYALLLFIGQPRAARGTASGPRRTAPDQTTTEPLRIAERTARTGPQTRPARRTSPEAAMKTVALSASYRACVREESLKSVPFEPGPFFPFSLFLVPFPRDLVPGRPSCRARGDFCHFRARRGTCAR